MKPTLTFYTRSRCPLCDKAKADILDIREHLEFEFDEIDIESSDELTEQYGLMIPVIYIDGEEIGYGIVDKLYLSNRLLEKQAEQNS